MNDFLLACIEEAKKAGLYDGGKQKAYVNSVPASFTIIDLDSPSGDAVESDIEPAQLSEYETKSLTSLNKCPDVPPLPDSEVNKAPVSIQRPQDSSSDYLLELRNLLHQETLLKDTIAKQASDFHRLRRNHGFELRLLQKAINNGCVRGQKERSETSLLSERLIKVITERDHLQTELIRLDERMLNLKQCLMNSVKELNKSALAAGAPEIVRVLVVGTRSPSLLTISKSDAIFVPSLSSDCSGEEHIFDLRDD
jgi:hypothetical protein